MLESGSFCALVFSRIFRFNCLQGVNRDGTKQPEQRYKLLTSADLAALPPLAWRVRGVVYGSPLDAML